MKKTSSFVAFVIFGLLTLAPGSLLWGAQNDLILPSSGYTQQEFKDLTETLGLLISYKPLAPAEPLGILGFDLGVEFTAVDIDQDQSFLRKAVPDQDPPSFFIFPKLHIQKGLPFAIDLGVVYAKIPDSNIGLIGGEVKWAILKGTVATPAIAVRGSYTALTGVGAMDLFTYGIDLSASKGFGFLTPYIGLGQVWIEGEETAGLGLSDEELLRTKGFAGLKLKLLLLSLVAEAEFSEILSYSFRANISF